MIEPPGAKKSPQQRGNAEGGKGVSGETRQSSKNANGYPRVKVEVRRINGRTVIRSGRAFL